MMVNRPIGLLKGQSVGDNCHLHRLWYPLGGITHLKLDIWTQKVLQTTGLVFPCLIELRQKVMEFSMTSPEVWRLTNWLEQKWAGHTP